jgi:hypothetical protein
MSQPLPSIIRNDSRFGFSANQFGFSYAGSNGLTVVVEACTDLNAPAWVPMLTNTITQGTSYFSDPQWTNYPARFYRLRAP